MSGLGDIFFLIPPEQRKKTKHIMAAKTYAIVKKEFRGVAGQSFVFARIKKLRRPFAINIKSAKSIQRTFIFLFCVPRLRVIVRRMQEEIMTIRPMICQRVIGSPRKILLYKIGIKELKLRRIAVMV